MAKRAYEVSFRGIFSIRHTVELESESVYEAAIRGICLLKKDGCVDNVGRGTELEVQVREPETRHTVTVKQLQRWCDGVTASLAETIRRTQLKTITRVTS